MRNLSLILFLVVISVNSVFAQTSFDELKNQNMDSESKVNFSIRFQNKTVYNKDSIVTLKASIENNTPYDYIFELADDPFFNVDINVSNMVNVAMPVTDAFLYRRQNKMNDPVLSRLISLKSGEVHSFEIILNEYVDLPENGSYVVNAEFRPKSSYGKDEINLAKGTGGLVSFNTIKSPSLILTITNRVNNKEAAERELEDFAKNEILARENLFPNQVVEYILDALQTKQWNKYFLYLDLEQLFLLSGDKAKKYKYADVNTRAKMMQDFKDNLSNMNSDDEISVVPIEYDIIKTSYTDDRAEVVTREVFRKRQYDEVKEFHFYLRKNTETNVWLVYDYYVLHLGNKERPKNVNEMAKPKMVSDDIK